MRARLQALAERDLERWPQMPARLIHVLAPEQGIDVEVVAGVADRASAEPLPAGSRFRIASVTKTFVGAAALRLVESGRLQLDATLDDMLPGEPVEVLRDGGYDTGAITLRHLMTHTSGIYDFAASAYDPTITDGFDAAIAADPRHRWSREEQLRFAIDHGEPYGPAGRVYGYSDTNANLVGEVIERETGLTLGGAIRDLVGYERLGLRHTYQETIEPEPPDLPPWSHQYEGAVDVLSIDPSVDLYGGGGLVSTSADLGRFFRALLLGQVYDRPSTLATMTTRSVGVAIYGGMRTDDDPDDAASFIFRASAGGQEWWGHDGWWGTTAYTCPALDLTVVAGHQQAHMPDDFDRKSVLAEVLGLLGSD